MTAGSVLRRAFFAALAAGATACARYDDDDAHTVRVPSRAAFSPVSGVIEQRCGSLDCHGAPPRNMRVYGVYGLRADGSSVTGNPDTTDEEVDATYQSVLTIDPEVLSRVLDGAEDPSRWIVLSKSTGRESHEGGARLPEGSAGHRCIVSWVTGEEDPAPCTEDVFGPEPRDGDTW